MGLFNEFFGGHSQHGPEHIDPNGIRKNHRQLTLTDDETKKESGQEDPLSGIRNLFDC